MIGDTNIFLKRDDGIIIGEVGIMIAEVEARGKGFGKETVLLILRFGVENLKINVFEAKIGISNKNCLSLFESLGFEKISENHVFNEITVAKKVSQKWIDWLKSQTQYYKENIRNQTIIN